MSILQNIFLLFMEKHKNFLSENRSFFILLLDSAYLLTEVFLSFPVLPERFSY
ncbi:hypothetical protein CLOLEP_02976 [[Clostridium] leptum DSM 753]|uniref:Uncharacterized protein n=1 Tax=[Clostridium] leptum DSM 753 TaxID=428125 RepID=A7VWL1_9FIRM|nr:hypothetical protein CLOLEP_02976 [[Clostridium] leptum DSM 753]